MQITKYVVFYLIEPLFKWASDRRSQSYAWEDSIIGL